MPAPQKSGELRIQGEELPPEGKHDVLARHSACGSGTSRADSRTFTSRSLKAMENSVQGEFREIAVLITGQEFSPTSFTLA